MTALCRCVIPQAPGLHEVPLAALVDEKLAKNSGDGYRDHRLPPLRDAWRTGLAALDNESRARFKLPFASIEKPAQLALLAQIQRGELKGSAWQGMPSNLFFSERVLHNVCSAYYSRSPRVERNGFRWPGQPSRLCAHVFRSAGPLGSSGSKAGQ
jgi:hypothetical protein